MSPWKTWIREASVPWWVTGLGVGVVFAKPLFLMIDALDRTEYVLAHRNVIQRFLESGWGTLTTIVVGGFIIAVGVVRGLRQQMPTTGTGESVSVPAQSDAQKQQIIDLGAALYQANETRVQWQQKAFDLERDVKTAITERDDARAETARLTAEYTTRLTEVTWNYRYEEPYPAMPAIGEVALASALPFMDTCMKSAFIAARELDTVLTSLRKEIAASGEGTAGDYLERFVRETVQGPLTMATNLLSESRADPRAAFVTFSARYHRARAWISRAVGVILAASAPLPVDQNGRIAMVVSRTTRYREWWNADAAFLAKLDDMLAVQSLSPVRKAIAEWNHQHDAPVVFTPAMRPAA